MTERTLLRTDKNGTKYYHVKCTCGKCGGRGIISVYVPINGGDCFDCGGSGILTYEEKEYTPEYEAKLAEQRQKRYEKKLALEKAHAAEKNAEFFEKNGFNPEGKTYFVLGNTYDIKEELKAQGAKWDNTARHWHLPNKPEGLDVETLELTVDQMYKANAAGVYDWRNWRSFSEDGDNHYYYKIEAAENALKASKSTSEYLGKVGEKLEIVVTYIHTASWETEYGGYWNTQVTNLHTFKDEAGNIIVWKTANYIEADYGTKMTIKGTVKEHSEYKGIKQTVLTRCKLS